MDVLREAALEAEDIVAVTIGHGGAEKFHALRCRCTVPGELAAGPVVFQETQYASGQRSGPAECEKMIDDTENRHAIDCDGTLNCAKAHDAGRRVDVVGGAAQPNPRQPAMRRRAQG